MTKRTHSTVAGFCFTTMALAALVTLSMSSLTFAEGGAKGKAAADRDAKKRAGAAGKPGPGKQGQGGGKDPARMAQRMIEHHDKNGDGALNAQELAAALTAMREMRQKGGRPGAGGGKDGAAGRKGGAGGGKGRADGGKRPKRPE